jgi:lariat debranching enzyme
MFAATMPHDNVPLQKTVPSAGQPAEWAVDIADPVTPDVSSASIALDSNVSTKVSPDTAASKAIPLATGDEPTRLAAWNNFHSVAIKSEGESNLSFRERLQQAGSQTIRAEANHEWRRIGTQDNRRQIDPAIVHQETFSPSKKVKVKNDEEIDLDSGDESTAFPSAENAHVDVSTTKVKNDEEIDLDSGDESMASPSAQNAYVDVSTTKDTPTQEAPVDTPATTDGAGDSRSLVDQAVRDRLPASLSRPVVPAAREAKKVNPPGIHNKLTRFLALDKPNNRDPYLQLLEISPVSDQENIRCQRPYRLQYDKEWLAITRVFADELHLGDPSVPVPPNLGEEEYMKKILEEEDWVEENLVKKDLMNVPFNFQCSAPKYDPAVPLSTKEQPMEFNNIQTAEFTKLLQIPNKFETSDEERVARHNAGPRPMAPGRPFGGHVRWNYRGPGRGRGGRGGRGRGRDL